MTVDAGAAGVLEAADLVKAHKAERVAVFADPPDSVDQEFLRRGIPYENKAAEFERLLVSLGVKNIETIPRNISGTDGERDILPGWCDVNQVRSVIVVTTPDHSRRVRRVLMRAMKGHATRIMIRPASFSAFNAERWWQSHSGVRTEIIELQKLILDVLQHPF